MCVSVLGHVLNASIGRLQLCLSLHFILDKNLKVSQRREIRAFPGLSRAYVQLYT